MSSPGSAASPVVNVDTPIYPQLKALYARLQGDAAAMSDALKPADQQMAAGQTWVGPAARSWGSDLRGRSKDCASQVSNMLAEVEQAIASTPAKVTPQEAHLINMNAR